MAITVKFRQNITATISGMKWHCADIGFLTVLEEALFDHQLEWVPGSWVLNPDLVIAVETIADLKNGTILSGHETPAKKEVEPDTDGLPRIY